MKVDLSLFFIYFLSLFCISPSSSFPLFHSCPGSLAHKLCMPALLPPLPPPFWPGWAGLGLAQGRGERIQGLLRSSPPLPRPKRSLRAQATKKKRRWKLNSLLLRSFSSVRQSPFLPLPSHLPKSERRWNKEEEKEGLKAFLPRPFLLLLSILIA